MRAVKSAHQGERPRPPFVRSPDELWGEPAFQRLNAVADALKRVAHDTLFRDEERRRKLHKALVGVLNLVEEGIRIRLPRTIQLFRRYEDGHATHYEEYVPEGTLVRCFECRPTYDLHRPYSSGSPEGEREFKNLVPVSPLPRSMMGKLPQTGE